MHRETEERFFFSKNTFKWSTVHRKMPSITNHQGPAIKTTMKYHLTLVRMTVIKKIRKSKYWGGCGEEGTLVHY